MKLKLKVTTKVTFCLGAGLLRLQLPTSWEKKGAYYLIFKAPREPH